MRETGTPGTSESARSRVLFIYERNSGKRFMIDSGADVSAMPLISQIANGSTVVLGSKLSTERALKPMANACSNSTLAFVVLFPTFSFLLMFPTPSLVPTYSNDSTCPSVFAGGASLNSLVSDRQHHPLLLSVSLPSPLSIPLHIHCAVTEVSQPHERHPHP